MSSYDKYLPKKGPTVSLQADVDKSLYGEVKAVVKGEGWMMGEFIEGLLHKFLDEYQAQKKVVKK